VVTSTDYLLDPSLREFQYRPGFIARFRGPGLSWEAFRVSRRQRQPDGFRTIGQILDHWNQMSGFDQERLRDLVRDRCGPESYEYERLAAVLDELP
jgi:hypothetical protein